MQQQGLSAHRSAPPSYRKAEAECLSRRLVGSIIKLPIMVPKAFQAGYPNTTGFRKVVKATVYVKKKEGMSDEDFIEYYNTKHAQSAVPILQRHGIISYSLVNIPSIYSD
jgi:hypothetical protein